jgi:hypothetical protein
MGNNKEPAKKVIMPSTTRKGTYIPSRPYFSPEAITPATKKKVIVNTSSALSIMLTCNERNVLDVDKNKECTI